MLRIALILCIALSLTGPALSLTENSVEHALKIVVLDMNQADAMLVVTKDKKAMLIDCGEPTNKTTSQYKHAAAMLEKLTGKRELEYFVLTHYHWDHMGGYRTYRNPNKEPMANGLFGLLEKENVTIKNLVDRGDSVYPPTAKNYLNYRKLLEKWMAPDAQGKRRVEKRVTAVEEAATGDRLIRLGGETDVRIVAVNGNGVHARLVEQDNDPFEQCPPSENDFSIALVIKHGDFEMFTGGDLTGNESDHDFMVRDFGDTCSTYTNIEREIAKNVGDVEIYRADHHGSGHSSSASFVEKLDPEFTLISCGGGYDHPEADVSYRLAKTSHLVLTDSVSAKEWPEGFGIQKHHIVGDIYIHVLPGGSKYLLQGSEHKAYPDDREGPVASPPASAPERERSKLREFGEDGLEEKSFDPKEIN